MYATQADIDTRYGSALLLTIADRDGDGVADADLVAAALSDADQLIEGYLAERYQLPLATVPSLLVTIAVDVAVYRLAELPTEEQRNRYKDAQSLLKNIAGGSLQLGLAKAPTTAGQSPVVTGPGRQFGRGKVRNW